MDEQVTIVGMGEIGRRFDAAATAAGIAVQRVTHDEGAQWLDGPPGTALLLCVRETDLTTVLAKIPRLRGRDVVFLQNGFIDELVAEWPDATRAALWFTSKGSFFADILQSPVHGPRETLVRTLINRIGATGEAIADPAVFRRYALEKAVWSCVVGAPLAAWGLDLETARHERMAEIDAIVTEACEVVRVALEAEISPKRVMATLDDTSAKLGWMKGGTRAIGWRNGRIAAWGAKCGVPTPANDAIVRLVARAADRVTEIE